jgi:hypothetical protein
MKTPQKQSAPDLHAWAGQNLGVPVDASARQARAAFMSRLAEYQWLPPPAVQESLDYWTRPAETKIFPSLREQAFADEEYRLRAQIDEFAQNFFKMAAGRRQIRYQELVDQCAWSVSLSGRLRTLAAGLDLNSRDWENLPPAQQELARHVCELFVLPGAERARRRWQLLQELEGPGDAWKTQVADWKFAAQDLQKSYPDLAALEPVLIDELAWGKARRQRDRARIPRVVTNLPPQPAPTSGGGNGWPVWIIIGVVIAVIRIAFSSSHNTPVPKFNPPPPPNFQNFQNPPPQPPIDWKKFQDDQMKKFQEDLKKNPQFDPNRPNQGFPNGNIDVDKAVQDPLKKMRDRAKQPQGPGNNPPPGVRPDQQPRDGVAPNPADRDNKK